MPLLSEEDQARLLVELGRCTTCQLALRRQYCRQCDEFFVTGHKADCASATVPQHQGHRTYERPPMPTPVNIACESCLLRHKIDFSFDQIGTAFRCRSCTHNFILTPALLAHAVAEEIYDIGLAHGRNDARPEEETPERVSDAWRTYAVIIASVFQYAKVFTLPGAPVPRGWPDPSNPHAPAVLEFVNGLHAKLKAGVDVPALVEVILGVLEAVAKLILLFTAAPTPAPAPPTEGR